jgi:hypothetical protein
MWCVIDNMTNQIVERDIASESAALDSAMAWNMAEGYSNQYRAMRQP